VRELIEITLVKNPGMRYRSGGQFADAVAAVRSGRRPPRPNSAPTIKATPAAIPGPPRAAVEAARAATASRPRSTAGHRTPPPARRTFSSGQRALLWAAGVLGALAIISAILIVLADRNKRTDTPVDQTVTETVPADAPDAPVTPSGFTEQVLPGGADGDVAALPAGWRNDARPAAAHYPDGEALR
jgi:serine/threonine-protein kinase